MKTINKIIILLFVMLTASTLKVTAQTGPVECRIIYGYDVAGNRIHREYKCENTWLPADPMQGNVIFTNLYPNPTPGPITGTFSEPVGISGSVYLTVSTMGGITVFHQEYTQLMTSVTINIAQQIPGQYLLTVAALNRIETYIITKI